MSEEWRAIPGYEGLYEVSSEGRVRSLDRVISCTRSDSAGPFGRDLQGRELKQSTDRTGRLSVNLSRNGRARKRRVHTLVAEAFVGPRPEGLEVCHGDGDPSNNRVSNLRYGTASENWADRKLHGTDKWERCRLGHVKPNGGRRECRECKIDRSWFASSYMRHVRQREALMAAVGVSEFERSEPLW